jgi:hypothetical protein
MAKSTAGSRLLSQVAQPRVEWVVRYFLCPWGLWGFDWLVWDRMEEKSGAAGVRALWRTPTAKPIAACRILEDDLPRTCSMLVTA